MQISPTKSLLLGLLLLVFTQAGCTTPSLFRHERATGIDRSSKAAIPSGMRRTQNGWEDSSKWFVVDHHRPRSIDAWRQEHRQREAGLFRTCLEEIRSTPPLMIALIQIAAIAIIVRVSRNGLPEPQ